MKTELFDFSLPEGCIAFAPASPKESARMLRVDGERLQDAHIYDFPDMLQAGDVLVLNNSKVIPARLYGVRGDVKIEVLLHKSVSDGFSDDDNCWKCFCRPAKRLKIGQIIDFAAGFSAEVLEKLPSGEVILRFNAVGDAFLQLLHQHGEMPLPPYIERPDGAGEDDLKNYQTCYAKTEGSVAAPTAGLHFSDELLQRIKDKGVEILFVTLHVGGGTFLPVKVDDVSDHQMHSEWGGVCEQVAKKINEVKAKGGRVIPVGTTSLRVLESAADDDGIMHPFFAETDIFITPGYRFKVVDMLLTNFHLPRSTLFMLVSAFAGLANMKAAYKHAIEAGYRFYSYGDACLLETKCLY